MSKFLSFPKVFCPTQRRKGHVFKIPTFNFRQVRKVAFESGEMSWHFPANIKRRQHCKECRDLKLQESH